MTLDVNPNPTLRFSVHRKRLDGPAGIQPEVQRIMGEISEVSDTELIVRLHRPDLPTFTFIDLPGIRASPASMAEQTTALVRRYLAQEHVLVLCVVPATLKDLSTDQAVALISEFGKQGDTILALTHADHVADKAFREQIMERVLGVKSETKGINFAGRVAVINPTQEDGQQAGGGRAAEQASGANRVCCLLTAFTACRCEWQC